MDVVMSVNCRIYCLGGRDASSQGMGNGMVVITSHFIHRSREAIGKVAIVVNLGTIIQLPNKYNSQCQMGRMQEGNITYKVYCYDPFTTYLENSSV